MNADQFFLTTAADAIVVVHFLFIVFVVVGGLLVLRRPKLAWLHVPAALWGILIELAGWICPLTPLEVRLRVAAGEEPYSGGFIAHYLLPLVYPDRLTRGVQIVLGLLVVGANAAVYGLILARRRKRR